MVTPAHNNGDPNSSLNPEFMKLSNLLEAEKHAFPSAEYESSIRQKIVRRRGPQT